MALNPFKRKPAAAPPPVIPDPAAQQRPTGPAPRIPAQGAPAAQQSGVFESAAGPVAPAAADGSPAAAAEQPVPPVPPPARPPKPRSAGGKSLRGAASELRRHREDLASRFAEGQYNLGGLVYEMGIRKDYRMEVVEGRVEALQRLDAELAETDRVLRLDDAAASGSCSKCGALFARNSSFCWQCGTPLANESRLGEPVPPPVPAPAPPQAPPAGPPSAPPAQ